jgi:YgiT-type zinc finger domain-containing protein
LARTTRFIDFDMTGVPVSNICPTCGGRLEPGVAHVPFILSQTIVVVKNVPAEICGDCHAPFMAGHVTNQVLELLNQLRALHSEVSVVAYPQVAAVA